MSYTVYNGGMLEIVSREDNINLWSDDQKGKADPVRISINEGYKECWIALTLEEAKAFAEHLNKLIGGLENANKS